MDTYNIRPENQQFILITFLFHVSLLGQLTTLLSVTNPEKPTIHTNPLKDTR